MRSITAVALAIMACGLLASACHRSEAGEPASQPAADEPDPDVVQWRAHCDLDDGRRLLTDGSLLLESRYVPNVPVPEKTVPAEGAQRLLQSETDHEFGLADLDRKAAGGHYVAPRGIHLNRKYVDLLRGSPLKATVRFRAKGANDPVLILDGKDVVGVMMPMKA
jgi:hypothetical protein